MNREFETVTDVTVAATPEEVWEAIATGPGIDSWFMGRNDIEGHVGGRTMMTMPGLYSVGGTVTAYDPPNRFALKSDEQPDGSFHAFEYLVEGREGGSTVIRVVHHGVLSVDGWELEFDALRKGDPLYFNTIRTYLEFFGGRTLTPISAWAPQQPDEAAVWAGWLRGLSLSGTVRDGDKVTFTLPGRSPESGVVDSVLEPGFLGVRTDSGLYRFVGRLGFGGLGHHVATDEGVEGLTAAWQAWLSELFPAA